MSPPSPGVLLMEDECTPGQRAWAPVLTPLTLDWPHWWWGSQSRSFTSLLPLETEGAPLWQEGEHQLKTQHWGCHLPQTGHHCSWRVLSYLVLFGEKVDESLIFFILIFQVKTNYLSSNLLWKKNKINKKWFCLHHCVGMLFELGIL